MISDITEILNKSNIDFVIHGRTDQTIGKRMLQAKAIGFPYIIIIGKGVLEEIPKIEVISVNDSKVYNLTLDAFADFFTSNEQCNDKTIRASGLA